MTLHRRLLLLGVIMSMVTVGSASVAMLSLYRAAVEQQRARLIEIVQSRIGMIEAVLEHEHRYEFHTAPVEGHGDPLQATLAVTREAHRLFPGFGRSGEFTLARREEGRIVFLLRHRHGGLAELGMVQQDSDRAEPMRRALDGHSGTLVGSDYRGEQVLAAHAPIPRLGLGLVAKIDLAEIRRPFLRAALASGLVALGLILLGLLLFARIGTPIMSRVAKSEREYQRAQRLESLGVLAGGIAHDFNNILTAILGNLNLAGRSPGIDQEPRELIREAEQASKRAKGLTQQLMTFAKGGAPVRRPEDIGRLLEEGVRFCLRGSPVRADLALPENLWRVQVDAGQIGQVINNVVLNALAAMPGGGTLEVRAENVDHPESDWAMEAGPCVRISIRDQGIGIDPVDLDRIFDPYFTTREEGSGLGLATSYAILRKHGGHIWAESEPGQGSLFTLVLPVGEVEDPMEDSGDRPVLPEGSGRILLMDDQESVRSIAERMLTRQGFRVELAADGEEALRLYRQALGSAGAFDLVILDLTIPGGMGGLETLKRLRELDPEVRAVVSSGYSDDPVMSQGEQHGFQAVIAKPYTLEELAVAVRRALE